MGRASRTKHERTPGGETQAPDAAGPRQSASGPVSLPPEAYWELRARASEADRDRAAALQQARESAASQQRVSALLSALAATHGFDASAPYDFDDSTLSIVPVSQSGR